MSASLDLQKQLFLNSRLIVGPQLKQSEGLNRSLQCSSFRFSFLDTEVREHSLNHFTQRSVF